MKLKDMPKVELEVLSYTDLTYRILKENKKTMNTPSIFKEICQLLEYSDEEYANKIGDYYTSLTLDKRFVLLENAEWDLRENRSVEVTYDDEDEEEVFVDEDDEEEEDSDEEEEDDVDAINDDDDLEDDSTLDLNIVSEDELEEEM